MSSRSPKEIASAWLTEFVMRPHPDLGRAGAVCPFVEAAVRSDSLIVEEVRTSRSNAAEVVDKAAGDALVRFNGLPWPSAANRHLPALVLVFPDLPAVQHRLLDEVQARHKSSYVEAGLMLGQFHPQCEEPAARNPAFRPSRSPIPLLAVRRLAFHDIVFLVEKFEWFHAYDARFGHRFRGRSADRLDPLFVSTYEYARRLHDASIRP